MKEKIKELIVKESSIDFSCGINAYIIYDHNLDDVAEKIVKLLNIPVVIDCSTCKHNAVSKYVEPCYGCRDNDSYDNYESAIIL